MVILGISAYYHDSAAALLRDGNIVSACQEERFSRKKHDSGFPRHAVAACLAEAGLALSDVDHVVFYDKPLVKFERLVETYLAFAPRGFASFRRSMPIWLKEKLFLKQLLADALVESGAEPSIIQKIRFSEHHLSHAASAYYPSPFERAAVLTMDGVGEWATTSLGVGDGASLEILKEIHFPHSLGLLYSAFTYHAGFKVNSGEYKLMGLAPYGEPRYRQLIEEHLIDVHDDGSFRLDLGYFDYCTGLTMTNDRFDRLFGVPARRSDEAMSQAYMDMAASIQAVTAGVVLRLARHATELAGTTNLCLAGGVALNCVANGELIRELPNLRLWVQPAAGDAGGALGAALAYWYLACGQPRTPPQGQDGMRGGFLGPSYPQAEIERRLRAQGARFEVLDDQTLLETCASDLADEQAIGWFQGAMEFGPRALGNRSILADARAASMQSRLNLKIKKRESFRPFAPAVLAEDAQEWFDLPEASPYMLLTAPVRPRHRMQPEAVHAEGADGALERVRQVRSGIPAVTHIDYSARVQTVDAVRNPRFHALLQHFKQRTGCGVVVNTSFNERGEPPVESPEDAFRCFMATDLDRLYVGNCYLRKEEQEPSLADGYRVAFEPD